MLSFASTHLSLLILTIISLLFVFPYRVFIIQLHTVRDPAIRHSAWMNFNILSAFWMKTRFQVRE